MSFTQLGILFSTFNEQTSQSFSDKTSDVIAVLIKVLYRVHTIQIMSSICGIISHSIAHTLSDIFDDDPIILRDLTELFNDDVKLHEKLSVRLIRAIYPSTQ